MAYRYHPKNAEVDPDNPQAWARCDRCSFIFNHNKLQFQYDYQGTPMLQNTGFLVCSRCTDVPNPQQAPYILPPDPEPIMNARPETYAVDETNWLTTEDGDIITAEDDDLITPSIPDPTSAATVSVLACSITASGGSVATAYLDLFNGNPATTGTSVLAAITGSATRTNIAASLTTVSGIATNAAALVVDTASAATVNISYVGIYNAASGGTLLMSGTVSASPTIVAGYTVQFNALGLSINLN